MGAYSYPDRILMGACITTVSKRNPKIANLQLLHTFANYRKRGVGAYLSHQALLYALSQEAEYFRVSAEPSAVPFYTKIGFTFWGKQKSGSLLSMFKIGGDHITHGIYDKEDPVIRNALYSGRKGGLVDVPIE